MNARQKRASASAAHTPDPAFDNAFWSVILGHFFSHAQLRGVVEAELIPRQLGLAHHRAMAIIYKNPDIIVGQLRAHLRVSSQALNTVLSLLIRRGLVTQQAGKEDRRTKHLLLTTEGCKIVEVCLERQLETIRDAARACGPEAVKGFITMTRSMADEEGRQQMGSVDDASVEMLCLPHAKARRRSTKPR